MKKKAIALLLVSAMVASLAACGAQPDAAPADTAADAAPAAEATDGSAPAEVASAASFADEGKVLNIQCWNEEFKSRVTDHYPGYEEVDATHGKIGDVDVVWTITPSDDLAYQNNLDDMLLNQENAAADDKVDLFLIEADYALKYVNSPYTMAVSDLGITDDMIADQYQYTKDVVTDGDGVLKGLSWQACPGGLFYNREIAKEVFGTDDAAEIQELVKDWDTFQATAATLKEAGYQITATSNDTYRVFSNNVSSKWVEDGKVNIDENITKWVEMTKEMVDAGQTGTADLWSDPWKVGFFPEGKVFCYFGPAWLINFCMAADEEGSVANLGQWGITEGPQGFFWGGTWICGATGTDNPGLVGDIMAKLTTDKDIMIDIVKADDDFVNNQPAMEELANDTTYSSKVLGGINPLSMYAAGAKNISLEYTSPYDQACNEGFQNAIKAYFEGTATYDEALEVFYKDVAVKHPELAQ